MPCCDRINVRHTFLTVSGIHLSGNGTASLLQSTSDEHATASERKRIDIKPSVTARGMDRRLQTRPIHQYRRSYWLRNRYIPKGRWHMKTIVITGCLIAFFMYCIFLRDNDFKSSSQRRQLVVKASKPYKSYPYRRRHPKQQTRVETPPSPSKANTTNGKAEHTTIQEDAKPEKWKQTMPSQGSPSKDQKGDIMKQEPVPSPKKQYEGLKKPLPLPRPALAEERRDLKKPVLLQSQNEPNKPKKQILMQALNHPVQVQDKQPKKASPYQLHVLQPPRTNGSLLSTGVKDLNSPMQQKAAVYSTNQKMDPKKYPLKPYSKLSIQSKQKTVGSLKFKKNSTAPKSIGSIYNKNNAIQAMVISANSKLPP